MTRGGSCESWSGASFAVRALAHARRGSRSLVLALGALGCVFAGPAAAQAVKGEATLTKPGEYARLVIKLRRQVEAEVRTSGSIVVVRFAGPIQVNVDKLPEGAPDFVGSARTDPDGSAIRLALSRKATPNVMQAGERLFIDLLPDTWSGPPPSLPQDVIKELAERAKEAESCLRQRDAALAAKKRPPVRVRASTQPTFTRYVFELPEGAGVSTILNKERLTLNFDFGADVRSCRCEDRGRTEHHLDCSEGRWRQRRRRVCVDRRGRRPFLPRREELHRRYRDRYQAGRSAEARAAEAGRATVGAGGARRAALGRDRRADIAGYRQGGGSRAHCAACQPRRRRRSLRPPVQVEAAPAPVPAAPPKVESAETKPDAEDKKLTLADVAAKDTAAPLITGDSTAITARRNSEGLRLTIPFAAPTPAAVFVRADSLWMIFDSEAPLDVSQIARDGSAIVRDALRVQLAAGRPFAFASIAATGRRFRRRASLDVHVADVSPSSPQPLTTLRNIADPARASVTVPFVEPGRLHRLVDPDTGDAVFAVTALLPARAFVKPQNFVEFAFSNPCTASPCS